MSPEKQRIAIATAAQRAEAFLKTLNPLGGITMSKIFHKPAETLKSTTHVRP